ncbi:PTS sugar transporter subunit IIA [Allobaculum sp. JKK-2023]|uniref:PTS sugar transporter subunit IIA n=1 Tax=Allobaculum sp. JKK-2023 TaxID=3108943 RepID=UPI002B061327|nr:PTS sugar transporter subunit IIA [Allobaculum sp. JKK-2023]
MKMIVVSHGGFAKGIVESVQMLSGPQEDLKAFGLMPEQTVNDLTDELEEELKSTPADQEVLFCTDLYHGSPFNAVVSLMRDYKFEHLTGINLPLLLDMVLSRYSGKSAAQMCEDAARQAGDTVMNVSQLFQNAECDGDEEED